MDGQDRGRMGRTTLPVVQLAARVEPPHEPIALTRRATQGESEPDWAEEAHIALL